MQINKKLTTIAITALLMLSMLIIAAPAFAALPSFTVTASTATTTVGASIGIIGSGGSSGGNIQFYWDNLGGKLLNSTFATGDVNANFTSVEIVPDTVNGIHYIIAYDNATGSTSTTGPIFVNAKITLSPTTGIRGDTVNITGTAFVASKTFNVTFYNSTGTLFSANVTQAPNTSSATGNITGAFVVPVVDYGIYTVNVTQWSGATIIANATANFNVNSTITLTPTSGPQGSVVAITGRGFNVTAGAPITLTVYNSAFPTNVPLKVVAPITTVAGGTFSGSFVLNTTLTGTLTINATDGTNIGSATFSVKGVTGITVAPSSGPPGLSIAITGSNFTAIAGTVVTIKFATLPLMTLTTDAAGRISGTFAVPSLPTTGYTITATDPNGLTASTPFTISITYVTVSPAFGATGSSLLVTAYGFTTGSSANVTLGTKVLGTGSTVSTYNVDVNTLQSSGITFVVPQLAVGTYNVTVVDQNGLTGTSSFAVSATSTLAATPSSAPANTVISVTTNYFGQSDSVAFTFKNATATYATNSATTNATGQAVASLSLPSTLALGAYVINATDAQGFTLEIAFNVIPATLNINPRSTTYSQGDVGSFSIQSSFPADFSITIYDPQGALMSITISNGLFVYTNGLYIYPYTVGSMWGFTNGADFIIPNDAILGTWTWNATVFGTTKSGTFTVQAINTAALSSINTKLDGINATLLGVGANVTSIKGSVATIQTTEGQIQANLTAINAQIVTINGNTATLSTSLGTVTTSINSMQSSVSGLSGTVTSISSGVATLQTTLGTVQTSIGSINSAIVSVAEGQATIQTTLGSITTSLSSIGTTVTRIDGNVATIQTDLGTLTGTVTSVSNGVATIQTSLGTMQTSLGNLKTDVTTTKDNTASLSPLIIVAIVLALVAAIAAIASIVLMRRKIAG